MATIKTTPTKLPSALCTGRFKIDKHGQLIDLEASDEYAMLPTFDHGLLDEGTTVEMIDNIPLSARRHIKNYDLDFVRHPFRPGKSYEFFGYKEGERIIMTGFTNTDYFTVKHLVSAYCHDSQRTISHEEAFQKAYESVLQSKLLKEIINDLT